MKYTVIALSVQGKGKKIFNAGDEVTAENFPEGNIPDLIKHGFLSEGVPVELNANIDVDVHADVDVDDQVILGTEQLNKKQIIAKLKELRSSNESVVFDANDDKQTLLDYLNSLV